MSRLWMPWYIGDYLKDTAHLTTEQHGAYLLLLAHCWQHGCIPLGDNERAAIAKLTPARWKSTKQPLIAFFKSDGTHKRVTKELEKSETVSIRRTLAGVNSAIARAAAKQIISKKSAIAQQVLEQKPSMTSSKRPDNHNHIDTTSTEQASEELQTAASLATAHPMGALARPPETEPAAKRPSDISRQEFEALFEKRRLNGALR